MKTKLNTFRAPSEHNNGCLLDLFGKPVWPVYPGSSRWVLSVSGTTLVPPGFFVSIHFLFILFSFFVLFFFSKGDSKERTTKTVANTPPICQKGFTCATTGNTEVPCSIHNTYFHWSTGSGFSDYISQPSFQTPFVTKYLSSGVDFPPRKHFNASNNVYAHVSAFGSRLLGKKN